ncbi:ribbon-helix-helix domain-containing protein [Hydrogenimonas urashimensis]|uniref:ribbon-helix-helix domain-containing protein n=1 Tax=Hydrogenimonas urashimensis TaxID=2740515 RepID=UPI00191544C3|nr:ribbon-helix-helix domain-containing protein [Hydrogenimonas urashimensis]
MHSLKELEKQQVGLRLPKYLIDEIDELTAKFSLNRTEVIIEAVKSYVEAQKEELFYEEFDNASKELKKVLKKEDHHNLQTLDALIDELENR